jgi:hypothetical protein
VKGDLMLSQEEVKQFLEKHGTRGTKALSILGKIQDFKQAYETEIGREILTYFIEMHDVLLDKIVNLQATDEEKIKYSTLRDYISFVSQRIVKYDIIENQIKEQVNERRAK